MIEVFSRTQDGEELLKRVASFGPPSLVWSQVAGVKVQQLEFATERTEVPAAAQVGGWIDMLGPGEWTLGRSQEEGVARAKVFGRRTLAMTPVAVGLCVVFSQRKPSPSKAFSQ